MDRHQFVADPDQDPTRNFYADPDPDPTPCFTHVGSRLEVRNCCCTLITTVPVYIIYLSSQCHSCLKFKYFRQRIEIFCRKV